MASTAPSLTRDGLVVGQTLHGYRSGHRLLMSSVTLDQGDERAMLELSDTGDLVREDDYPSLLTGYPLPSAKFYVLAITWAAPELPRAGCVWTHSLLIPSEWMAKVRSAEVLLSAFRRPSHVDSSALREYARPVALPPSEKASGGVDLDLAATLVWALYEPPAPPVNGQDVPLDSDHRKRLLLGLWSQQWSELRMEFAFAEAPTSPRRRNGTLLDLQLTRLPHRSMWEASPDLRTVSQALESAPEWAKALARDLSAAGPLRDFLWRHGPSLTRGDRTALFNLTRIHTLMASRSSPRNLNALADALADIAPGADQALELKGQALGQRRSFSAECEALMVLLDDRDGALDPEALRVDARAGRLARDEPDRAMAILAALIQHRSGRDAPRAMAAGLTDGLDDRHLQTIAQERPDYVVALFRWHPHAAARAAAWPAGSETDKKWRALKAARPPVPVRRQIVETLIAVRAEVDAQDVLATWPQTNETVVKALLGGKVPDETMRRWAPAITPKDLEALSPDLTFPDRLSESLARAWPAETLIALTPSLWTRLAKFAPVLPTRGLVAFYTASLERPEASAAPMACRIYQALYSKALLDQLDKSARRSLGSLDKNFSSTDLRRPLAHSLNRAYKRHDWPAETLLAIDDHEAFSAVLSDDAKGGLARRLATALASRGRALASWQVRPVVGALEKATREDLLELVELLLTARPR